MQRLSIICYSMASVMMLTPVAVGSWAADLSDHVANAAPFEAGETQRSPLDITCSDPGFTNQELSLHPVGL